MQQQQPSLHRHRTSNASWKQKHWRPRRARAAGTFNRLSNGQFSSDSSINHTQRPSSPPLRVSHPASINSTVFTPNRSSKVACTTTAGDADFKPLSNGEFDSDRHQNFTQRASGPPLRDSRPASINSTGNTPNRSSKGSSTTTAGNAKFKLLSNGHFSSDRPQILIQPTSGSPLRVSQRASINSADNVLNRPNKSTGSTTAAAADLKLHSQPQIALDSRPTGYRHSSGRQLT